MVGSMERRQVKGGCEQSYILLKRSTKAIALFFLAFLLIRYGTYIRTGKLPNQPFDQALDLSALGFVIVTVVTFADSFRDPNATIESRLSLLLLTSFSVSAGILTAFTGYGCLSAGWICGVLASVATVIEINLTPSDLYHSVGGAVMKQLLIAIPITSGPVGGIIAGLIVNGFSVLVSYIVGLIVLFLPVRLLAEENNKNSMVCFGGLLAGLLGGIAAGIVAEICDSLVLNIMSGVKHIPDGLFGGIIFAFIIIALLVVCLGMNSSDSKRKRM